MDNENPNWIWIKKWSKNNDKEPQLVLFRKKVSIKNEFKKIIIKLTADSRYKLWINGNFCEVGPLKGTKNKWYLDTIDVTNFFKVGINQIAIEVLRYPKDLLKGNFGINRTSKPGLLVNGEIDYFDSKKQFISDDSWKGYIHNNFSIIPEDESFAPLEIMEKRIGIFKLKGWKETDFDDSDWESTYTYSDQDLPTILKLKNLKKRPIPFMKRSMHNFKEIKQVIKSKSPKKDWSGFLQGLNEITIAPNSTEVIDISAGQEMTAYLYLAMKNGKDTDISVLQSEAYVGKEIPKVNGITLYEKDDREEIFNKNLKGFTDKYSVSGYGGDDLDETYNPFWFRTFRFIRLTIKTKDTPITLSRFNYEETGYPLKVVTKVNTSDPSMSGIWDLSKLTLQRCMHETYEDCPFYEQLQYVMDTRSQMLYTYAISGDNRLGKKAIDDFQDSQTKNGLLNGASPSYVPNVIPSFSIYYILMLKDYMMYFGDKKFLKRHMGSVDKILNYYDSHLTPEGYVGVIGTLNGKSKQWSFIDWAMEWAETTGAPTAIKKGPITIESLLYLYGLQKAQLLAGYLHENDMRKKYSRRETRLVNAIEKYCIGNNGMIKDGPNVEEYSQHGQVFGILTNVLKYDQGREILKRTINDKQNYAQCSIAMSFYLFRALEKVGLYDLIDNYWNIWRDLLKDNCTTSIESKSTERSECHAWGAVALYELPTKVLGVQPAEPGFKSVKISPLVGRLKYASGEVWTPKGVLKVNWRLIDNQLNLNYKLPSGLKIMEND